MECSFGKQADQLEVERLVDRPLERMLIRFGLPA